jgi:hypothetical protein
MAIVEELINTVETWSTTGMLRLETFFPELDMMKPILMLGVGGAFWKVG